MQHNMSLSSTWKDFIYLHHLNVEIWEKVNFFIIQNKFGNTRVNNLEAIYMQPCYYANSRVYHGAFLTSSRLHLIKQGKSEGFESCDRPTVGKCPIWVKIGDVLYRVTLKFDGWPWKTIGHLSFAVSSFVQHFIAIGEFKLELQSGNTQFGSNLMIFRAVWPWNLTDDLQKQ